MVTGDLSDLLVKRAERAEAELMSTRTALKIANATIAVLQAQAALDKSEIEELRSEIRDHVRGAWEARLGRDA